MATNATERIRHYNRMLIWHHKFIGGTILHGYGLSTRAFQWREGKSLRAWGADYTPEWGPLWLNKLLVGPDYDEQLGVPGTATCEAWLGVAEKLGKTMTRVTHYEYGTGAQRFIKPYISIGEYEVDIPFGDITTEHLRGGLGSWRGFFPDFPQATHDAGDAEHLAATLQSAAAIVVAQT